MDFNILQSIQETLSVPKADLQRQIWAGTWAKPPVTQYLRGLCWRITLGVLSTANISSWAQEMRQSVELYATLKSNTMPKMDSDVDPLTAASESNDEWKEYYKVSYTVKIN